MVDWICAWQGVRGMAAVCCGGVRYYLHRLVAFNTRPPAGWQGREWGNPHGRFYNRTSEVHHFPDPMRPRQQPWINSTRHNMVASGYHTCTR